MNDQAKKELDTAVLDAKNEHERAALLAHTIKTGVDLKLKHQACASAISCNIDNAKEELGCSPTYLRKLIDLEFNREYDMEKFEKDYTLIEDVVNHFVDEDV